MDWQTEFPDFPASDLPAIPASWTDTSWHNNACPSFTPFGAVELEVFVNYTDPAKREFSDGGPRFAVVDEDNTLLHETDDWESVLAFIKARRERRA